MTQLKEKRTREHVSRLLEKAIKREESLLEKIRTLEAELSAVKKRLEDPRSELQEYAIPGSKVSFRLDFYRTGGREHFKGIIEHLATRHNLTFESGRLSAVNRFVNQYLNSVESPRLRRRANKKTESSIGAGLLHTQPESTTRTDDATVLEDHPVIHLFDLNGVPKPSGVSHGERFRVTFTAGLLAPDASTWRLQAELLHRNKTSVVRSWTLRPGRQGLISEPFDCRLDDPGVYRLSLIVSQGSGFRPETVLGARLLVVL